MANQTLSRWAPQVLSVLRIIAAFLLIAHGSQKLMDFPTKPPPQAAAQQQAQPTPQQQEQAAAQKQAQTAPKELPPLMKVAGWLELVGGLLLLIGLFTRPVAFILSGFMAAAYFMAHAPGGFWPILNRGELAVILCFVFFYIFFAGGGPWSVDRLLRRGDT
ncbi:MAG TPA: DoxX family protein [Pyrinomonadaceae bacterium]|nr:DoxX family protein [Pyrinomonadaceae bacterium]